ncbi:uracil-DNA glycosylase family protein [Altererythrobacter sp. MF3-039]|uniref:uracil-DNA glycosylase family protein n=1 Tax=Altererythrobacter sp. MF3-039 TaxID=3252901 RepID=UPI00390C82CD
MAVAGRAGRRLTAALLSEIFACRHCEAHLPHGPRPVVQFSETSRILIIGQAPGSKVHASGIPWDDDSGDRLREWTGLSKEQFYDPKLIALMPMGFCYPGRASGGDKPPRPECAPLWHERVLAALPSERLTLLVGTYAQQSYLTETKRWSLAKRVESFRHFLPGVFPLPHPAWRSTIFMRKHPWFEGELLPELRAAIAARI